MPLPGRTGSGLTATLFDNLLAFLDVWARNDKKIIPPLGGQLLRAVELRLDLVTNIFNVVFIDGVDIAPVLLGEVSIAGLRDLDMTAPPVIESELNL